MGAFRLLQQLLPLQPPDMTSSSQLLTSYPAERWIVLLWSQFWLISSSSSAMVSLWLMTAIFGNNRSVTPTFLILRSRPKSNSISHQKFSQGDFSLAFLCVCAPSGPNTARVFCTSSGETTGWNITRLYYYTVICLLLHHHHHNAILHHHTLNYIVLIRLW